MEQQKALEAFAALCEKMSQMIDASTRRIGELEGKVAYLEGLQDALLTQRQVAERTGWSVSVISNWLRDGLISGVRAEGRKTLSIPASEVQTILRKKGPGRRPRKAS